MTPTALAAITALQPILTGAPAWLGSVAGLLVFSAAAFGPLRFFARAPARVNGG
jgi:hypothetical protein